MKQIVDVSVLATNYNNGKFLDEFFNSIIDSTVQPNEIIFIDDGSTDNSINIIKNYNNLNYLKTVFLEKNTGRANVLNIGKKICNSKYILIIDTDDIMLTDRIEKQYNFMELNPIIDVLGGNVQYFNSETGKPLNKSNFPVKNIFKTFRNGENGVLQPTVIVKTEILKKYDYKDLTPGQDYDIFARIAKDGYNFANLPDILNKMRIHQNSIVSNITFTKISKIFKNRDLIFKTNTSKAKIYFYYLHLKFYRKSMLETSFIKKYFFIFVSLMFYPSKLLKRIFSKF